MSNAKKLLSPEYELLIRIDERLKNFEKAFDEFKKEIGVDYARHEDLEIVRNDMRWIIKTYWIFVTASLGGLVFGIMSLLFK